MDGFKKLLLRLGLTQEKLKWLTYPFSLIYAAWLDFQPRSFAVSCKSYWLNMVLRAWIILPWRCLYYLLSCPTFFLTAGGVLSCAYAFILTMTSKEGEGLKAIARESLVISLGILPILPSILRNFNLGPSFWPLSFPFYLTWSSYRSCLSYLPFPFSIQSFSWMLSLNGWKVLFAWSRNWQVSLWFLDNLPHGFWFFS